MPQSLAKILVHTVFSTKDRRSFLRDKALREELHRYLGGILTNLDCQPIIIGGLIGSTVGAVAGYVGGVWDEILMRFTELFMAFPTIILAMAVSAALGPSIRNAVIALVVVWWPSYARLMRGLVLSVKNNEYVEATRSVGASGFYLLTRSIIPNCIAPMIVLAPTGCISSAFSMPMPPACCAGNSLSAVNPARRAAISSDGVMMPGSSG
jgi:peptide/nickel transport system permease protein